MQTITRTELLSIFKKNGVGAEIGAGRGNYTRILHKALTPTLFYIVDCWREQPAEKYGARYKPLETIQMKHRDKSTYQTQHDEARKAVIQEFSRYKEAVILHMTSFQALNLINNATLDWIYIDGGHLYEIVLSELFSAWRVVKPGGYIAGHDYYYDARWEDGVRIAVDEFIATGLVDVMALGMGKDDGQHTNYLLLRK